MRAPVKKAAARRALWSHVPDWAAWDAVDAAREGETKLYKPAAPWKSHIDFEGGLTTQVAA